MGILLLDTLLLKNTIKKCFCSISLEYSVETYLFKVGPQMQAEFLWCRGFPRQFENLRAFGMLSVNLSI